MRNLFIGIVIGAVFFLAVHLLLLSSALWYATILLVVLVLAAAIGWALGKQSLSRQLAQWKDVLASQMSAVDVTLPDLGSSLANLIGSTGESRRDALQQFTAQLRQQLPSLGKQLAPLATQTAAAVITWLSTVRLLATVLTLLTIAVGMATFRATQLQANLLEVQNSLVDSGRQTALITELSSILDATVSLSSDPANYEDDFDSFLPTIQLPPALAARAVSLSRALRPYRVLGERGQLTAEFYSPERGMLLSTLGASGFYLYPLLLNGDFRYAYLDDASLVGVDLMWGDFRGASFKNCDLRKTQWSYARLPEPAAFAGAMLHESNLEDAYVDSVDWLTRMAEATPRIAGFKASDWQLTKQAVMAVRPYCIFTMNTRAKTEIVNGEEKEVEALGFAYLSAIPGMALEESATPREGQSATYVIKARTP
jgi:hypothetical protein